MKQRIILFIETYILFVLIFVLQKPVFMNFYNRLFAGTPLSEYFNVMWHGLPLDFSIAGYLTVIPGLLLLASCWSTGKWLRTIFNIYFIVIAILLSVIAVIDLGLYEYWGFRLDATPIFYFVSSPTDAVASISAWTVIAGLLAVSVYATILFLLFRWIYKRKLDKLSHPWSRAIVMLLLTGLLFIPIRGGFTVSTMNVGKVYYSDNRLLNHAAINPAFSLLEGLSREKNFAAQYRFMDDKEATAILNQLSDPQVLGKASNPDSIPSLFNTRRPDVILIIMESFSSNLMSTLGGEKDVAVNLDSIGKHGILFTNFYANSFRTDRGLVSILSGYPAQPTTSIMKYPRKSQSLPSISTALNDAGYESHYYYGGDADFTNMRSYLKSSGFSTIVSDTDFPIGERLSKWGVHDHLVFQRFLHDIKADKSNKPQYRVIQTSSSHEPFEVPYHRLSNERLNAFAYTDSVIGAFIHDLQATPKWNNTVVILVPDHLGAYPENVDNLSEERYKIPLIMTGGAIKSPLRIDAYGSQIDIAATLLGQLGIDHSAFTFSKDIMNPQSPHYAFFTIPDAMGYAEEESIVIYDNDARRQAVAKGDKATAQKRAMALLQKLYDDLSSR